MSDHWHSRLYVQSAASQDVPPPYHFPKVTVNSFLWKAQLPAVQAYCDKFLNLGSREERGFEYRPLSSWPYLMLMFLDYPEMVSSNRLPEDTGEVPYPNRGTTSQREVFVSIPVMRYGNGTSGLFTKSEPNCILPFIVVDKPWSCVCGREMLGLGKLLADIDIGEFEFPDSFSGSVMMPGWKTDVPGEYQEMLPFLEVTTGPLLPTFRLGARPELSLATLLDSPAVAAAIERMGDLSNFVDYISAGLIPTSMRTVGLKQYRDAAHPEKAVYQALVTCRSHYTNVRDLRLYDEMDVLIKFHDFGSFRDILRVFLDLKEERPPGCISTSPTAAFRFTADVDYDLMRVIHEFPIDAGDGIVARPGMSDLTARWFRPIKGLFGKGARR
ncbi:hypothetical protein [Tsuneonella mangrovi]|uniref:hypothetical protein n=1 Tax=Tsuneonella mangrovi TaxID=1982042 RepID=UPI000BA206F3|nr:hypothetical protein [Tsuneonella mangrovi]